MMGSGNDLGFGITVGMESSVPAVARESAQALDELDRKSSQFADNMNRRTMNLDQAIKSNRQAIEESNAMMSNGFSLMAGGFAMLAPVGLGLKYAAEFETAEAGLITLTKSAEKTKEIMANVKADAAKSTMFGFEDLILGNRLLISSQVDAAEARKDINALADSLAASGGGADALKRMSVNMKGIKDLGYATSMDMKQFVYAGLDLVQLVAESSGKTADEVRATKITYDDISKALRHATEEGGRFAGAGERISQTIGGKWAGALDQFKFALAELGMAVKPVVVPIIDFLTELAIKFQALAQTKMGKVLIASFVGIGALVFSMGALALVMGAISGLTPRISQGFIDMGMKSVGLAIANGGLTASFGAIATAVWAALAPMIPFILIAAAVAGGLYLLMAAIGVEGREFEKFGAIVTGIIEIFDSWNGSTFELSQQTKEHLEEMGILDFFLKLSTWVVRAIEFFKGFFTPIGEVFSLLGEAFGLFGEILDGGIKLLRLFGIDLRAATGEASNFRIAGEILGYTFHLFLLPLKMAVGMLRWFVESMREAFDTASSFYDVGVVFVTGFLDGIKDTWKTVREWLLKAISYLPGGNLILKAANMIVNGGEDPNLTTPPQSIVQKSDEAADLSRTNKLNMNKAQSPVVLNNKSKEVKDIHLTIDMGPEKIKKVVNVANEDDYDRE